MCDIHVLAIKFHTFRVSVQILSGQVKKLNHLKILLKIDMQIYLDVSRWMRMLRSQILMIFCLSCTDDDSCVKLQCDGENESDYINASYIDVRKIPVIAW